jgi:hypothetical protein
MSAIVEETDIDASLVSAFNARNLTAREIASSFVPPDAFYNLIALDNCLLSGPRGSGKTTLLRMLQPEGLEVWSGPTADEVRSVVSYTGVHVPVDRPWNAQLMSAVPSEVRRTADAIAEAAFTAHVLSSIVAGFVHRAHGPLLPRDVPHQRVRLDGASEAELVAGISELARLPVSVRDLKSVDNALEARYVELGRLRAEAIRTGAPVALPAWIDLDFLDLAASITRLFNATVGDSSHRWALLIDELELTPPSVVEKLLAALRGLRGHLILKLSLSPVHEGLLSLRGPLAAIHGQDYEWIPLTYARKREAVGFARRMVGNELEKRRAPHRSADRLLGPSLFDTSDDAEPADGVMPQRPRGVTVHVPTDQPARGRYSDPYAPGTQLWKAYTSLSDSDASFRKWLHDHDVDLNRLDKLTPVERASKLRKIRNLVVVREFFRRSDVSARSRKTYALYAGADAILTTVDGNPRLLVALLRSIMPLASGAPGGRWTVSGRAQSRALGSVMDRFLALVRALEAAVDERGRPVTVLELLDAIGDGLSRRINRDAFKDNAPCCFRVDRNTPPWVVALLRQAVNCGAVVHVPRPGTLQPKASLVGEDFRLTYLLAPHYGLPLRLGPHTSLMSLVSASHLHITPRGRRKGRAPVGQGSLFGPDSGKSNQSHISLAMHDADSRHGSNTTRPRQVRRGVAW